MTGPFYKFLNKHIFARVVGWGDESYGDRQEERTLNMRNADIVNSNRLGGGHSLILDVDYPVYLAQSTNGNTHLFMDVPEALTTSALNEILTVLAKHGVIEEGYANASIERGHTSVRRPGRRKGRPITHCRSCHKRGDQISEYRRQVAEETGIDVQSVDIQDVEDWIYRQEGTIDRMTGLFLCTECYIKEGMPLWPTTH